MSLKDYTLDEVAKGAHSSFLQDLGKVHHVCVSMEGVHFLSKVQPQGPPQSPTKGSQINLKTETKTQLLNQSETMAGSTHSLSPGKYHTGGSISTWFLGLHDAEQTDLSLRAPLSIVIYVSTSRTHKESLHPHPAGTAQATSQPSTVICGNNDSVFAPSTALLKQGTTAPSKTFYHL